MDRTYDDTLDAGRLQETIVALESKSDSLGEKETDPVKSLSL